MKMFVLLSLFFNSFVLLHSQDNNNFTYSNDSVLWNVGELCEAFFDDKFDTISVCNNKVAISIFEERLSIIRTYILQRESEPMKEINIGTMLFSLYNFEFLTKIESESDSNFFGTWAPTLNDIKNWKDWFSVNKDIICYYKEKNILFLRQ